MKKKIKFLGMILVTLAACQRPDSHDGIYTAQVIGVYSIADDTLVVDGNFVTRRTGYQRIRKGKLLPRAYKSRTLHRNSNDFAVMQFRSDRIIVGQTIYRKQP